MSTYVADECNVSKGTPAVMSEEKTNTDVGDEHSIRQNASLTAVLCRPLMVGRPRVVQPIRVVCVDEDVAPRQVQVRLHAVGVPVRDGGLQSPAACRQLACRGKPPPEWIPDTDGAPELSLEPLCRGKAPEHVDEPLLPPPGSPNAHWWR